MSFLKNFKKKKDSRQAPKPSPAQAEPASQPTELKPRPSVSAQVVEQPPPDNPSELTSSSRAVEVPSSIFSGLHLNPTVRKKEGEGSPYLQRAQPHADEDDEPSAFDFLQGSDSTTEIPISDGGFSREEEEGEEEGEGGNGEGPLKSAFGFISQTPPEQPLPQGEKKEEEEREKEREGKRGVNGGGEEEGSEESGFSFLLSGGQDSATRPGGESKEKESREQDLLTAPDKRDHSSSPLTSYHVPPLLPNSPPPSTSTEEPGSQPHPPLLAVRNQLGVVSPVPGPTSTYYSPTHSPSHQPAERSHVGRQQPTAEKKKKKKKGWRPGQARADEAYSSLVETASLKSSARDLDSLSVNSQTSSTDGGREPTSITSSLSELHDSPSKTVEGGSMGGVHGHEQREGEGEGEGERKREEERGEKGEGESYTTTAASGEVGGTARDKGHKDRDEEKGVDGSGSRAVVEVAKADSERVMKQTVQDVSTTVSGDEGLGLPTAVLVDLSAAGHTQERETEGGGGRREGKVVERDGEGEHKESEEGGGREGGPSSDQQLLAEVFSGGREGGKEVGKEEDGVAHGANYDVELSAADKLTVLLQSLGSNLDRVRLDMSELQTERCKELDEHISGARQQRERRQQVRELKAKEAKALSDEDYEQAEELRGELESLSLDRGWNIASTSQTVLHEWLQKCTELMQSEITVQQNIQTQLTDMKEEQSQALVTAEEEIASTHTKQKMKLKALEDKIERERGHIALDQEHLEKREQQLQEETATRAEKFISRKSTLQEQLHTIKAEMAALEAKLAALREDEGQLLTAIGEEEEKIQAVHEELAGDHSQLKEERESLKEREKKLQEEVDEVDKVRQEYETAKQEEETRKQSISELVEVMSTRWAESTGRVDTLHLCLKQAEELVTMDTSTLLKPTDQLQRHQEALQSKENEVKEVTSQILSLQSHISSLRRKISETEERLPQLEKSKKAAVAARQYKEASRIASELKTLNSGLEPERQQVREMEEEVAKKNQQLSTLSTELAKARETLEEEEKEEDVEHIKQLASALSKIQAIKKGILESSAPLSQLLECWHQLYQLLAEDLCTKHDLQLAHFSPPQVNTSEPAADKVSPCAGDDGELEVSDSERSPPKERTPGVGREEEVEGEGGEGVVDQPKSAEAEEIKRKMAELEAKIEEACSEENFDLAAELDEELSRLKETLRT